MEATLRTWNIRRFTTSILYLCLSSDYPSTDVKAVAEIVKIEIVGDEKANE